MNYQVVPKQELKERVAKLQQLLEHLQYDGALLTQHVDLFYYSGTMQNSIMFIPKTGEPLLFVKKSMVRAKEETPFNIEALGSLKNLPEQLLKKGYLFRKVGIELDVLPYNQFVRIKKVFSDTQFYDLSPTIRLQRSIKSAYEIEMIRQSAQVAYDAMQAVPNLLRLGMTEVEFIAELERFIRVRGHIGQVRMRAYNQEIVLGMVVSGDSATVPSSFDGPAGGEGLTPAMPQGAGWKKIEKNEPILIDMAIAVNGYIVDQTRMAIIGELEKELEEAYQVSLHILKDTEKQAKPGTLWSQHYLNALKMAKEAGLEDYFMGFKEDQVKFLGHGVGLELDEWPVLAKGLDQPLEVGMVIAIEPKFTFPGKGVIGIENTYVVTEKGLESLSFAAEEIIKIP
ncbi:M24 family metallopeptidase [Tepidibacillus infernus]|uniref:Peptidase M24 n=1 Tax=Tepidibacillus decaturensis TaxID=1413211 RepID=A0A135L297_9BACI|nr:Xaa-Pro peptidase family protein [Tepidibacillus decaturensis]KXG43009.1 peptidase M24 [Tepidibacillus decaturensis]